LKHYNVNEGGGSNLLEYTVGNLDHIWKGFEIISRKPGLVFMKFALGFAVPFALFFLLSFPLLAAVGEALNDLASAEGIMGALEDPGEAIYTLTGPMIFFYAACLVCLALSLAGNSFSDKRTLTVLSEGLLGPEDRKRLTGSPVSGGAFYRTMMLYSLICSLASIILIIVFSIIVFTVSAIIASMAPGNGMLLKVMLMLTTVAVFVMSFLFMYSARLEGFAIMALEGLRPLRALARAVERLWTTPSTLNLTAGMLAAYVMVQPLMALAAFGIWRAQETGLSLVLIWCSIWVAIDAYIGLAMRAAVFGAHSHELMSANLDRGRITFDEVARILKSEEGRPVVPLNIWESFEQAGDGEDSEEGGISS